MAMPTIFYRFHPLLQKQKLTKQEDITNIFHYAPHFESFNMQCGIILQL